MRARARRHEAAHLRQDHGQRDLADERRLAGHVGAGDDQDLLAVGVEADVVGDEAARGRQPLDHGVAAVGDVDDAGVVDVRAAVAAAVGDLGQRRQRVGGGDAPGQRQQAIGGGGDLVAQADEDLQLQRDATLVGGEDLLFVLGQLGRDEALGVGDGLLAHVVGRDTACGSCARVTSM